MNIVDGSEQGSSICDDSPELQYCRAQWHACAKNTLGELQHFYSRYKYLVMSRSIADYRKIGALLAKSTHDAAEMSQRLFELLMHALAQPATRGGNVNALLHIAGYLKKQLQAEEKRELLDAIDRYGNNACEFEIPANLLREHFNRFPHPYIARQIFLYPDTGAIQP